MNADQVIRGIVREDGRYDQAAYEFIFTALEVLVCVPCAALADEPTAAVLMLTLATSAQLQFGAMCFCVPHSNVMGRDIAPR